jgi:RecA-family ATPase
MSITSQPPLDFALAYARRGWRVFPLASFNGKICSCGSKDCHSAGKHPRTKQGVKEATTDEAQIRAWWSRWPTANIGIATGIAEGATSGLYVIDVDTHKGAPPDVLEVYGHAALLATLRARTGSGGYHLYLKTDQPLPNTCDRLGPFVDTRGEGGYVVAPPSCNRNGAYTWDNTQPLQELPQSIIVTLTTSKYTLKHGLYEREQSNEVSRAAHAPVSPEVQNSQDTASAADVAAAAQSQPLREARNNYLTRVAGYLRNTGLAAVEICALLTTLNEKRYGAGRHEQGPLSLEELEKTIFKSVMHWEATLGVSENRLPEVNQIADLMTRVLPEPNWLVPDLLCEGLVLFAGKPKLGKSWLALSLALACAPAEGQTRGQAFGHYPVKAGGVLYLSLEDSEMRFQSRVRKLLGGRPIPSSFGYALSWKPLMSGGLQDLETILETASDTRLVVIDTLARVRTPRSSGGNVYQEDYTLMAELHKLTVRYHLTLIVVHHTRKMTSDDAFDEISGTIGLTGAADISMVLKRPRGEGDATLHITGRDVEEQELALTFDATTCTWTATGKAAERERNKVSEAILAVLAARGPSKVQAIVRELGIVYGTVSSALSRLVDENAVHRESRGLYRLSGQQRTESSVWDCGQAAQEAPDEKYTDPEFANDPEDEDDDIF